MKNHDLDYLRTYCQMKRKYAELCGATATGGAMIHQKALIEAYNSVIQEIDAVIIMRDGISAREREANG